MVLIGGTYKALVGRAGERVTNSIVEVGRENIAPNRF